MENRAGSWQGEPSSIIFGELHERIASGSAVDLAEFDRYLALGVAHWARVAKERAGYVDGDSARLKARMYGIALDGDVMEKAGFCQNQAYQEGRLLGQRIPYQQTDQGVLQLRKAVEERVDNWINQGKALLATRRRK